MSVISGWVGTGAGLITIGLCVIASWFIHLLPSALQQWAHRILIALMYCGATAVLITTIGQFAYRVLAAVTGFFGGTESGIGYVAIVLASVFLLLSVLLALWRQPTVGAGYLAIVLVFALALVPGGALHSLFAMSAAPGQAFAGQIASWIGG